MHFKVVIILLSAVVISSNIASVIITRYDDSKCSLDPKLVKEIASYKNVTHHIMDEITQKWGSEMYQKYTQFIDTFGARLSGSEVLEAAIDHMINLTQKYNLTNIVTENVKVPHQVRGEQSAAMIKPRHKNIAILAFGTSVNTPPEGITANVIVIKSFDELESRKEADIKGKIVVFDEPYVSYGKTVAYRVIGATKAAKKGAVATLIRSVTPLSLYTLHVGLQEYEENVTKIPAAAITHEDADMLRRLQNMQKEVILTVKIMSTFDEKNSRNTIIDLKGREHPDKQVIVSGHIDSWDVGDGAMDDGGGMFISWFVPVILNRMKFTPRRTIRAILWTAEEFGLIGAQAYLKAHEKDLNNITFIMESDEGTFQPLGLDIGGSHDMQCVIAEILKLFTPIDNITVSGHPGSDIAMFVKEGVPGASLLNANERYFWYHHSEADTLDVQNETSVVQCAAFWSAVSFVIADLSVEIPR